MHEKFKFKPIKLSDTVYSELIDKIQEAYNKRDIDWLLELYIEAFILLKEAGLVDDNNRVNVNCYPKFLLHCHLDAQVIQKDEEDRNNANTP